VVTRFCPSRTFSATLTPRGAPDDAMTLRGKFADGKLFEIDATLYLPQRSYTKEEDRVAIAAFDASVTRILGAPTSIKHNDPFMSDAPPHETTVSYGDALWLSHTRNSSISVVVVGGRALYDALVKQDEAIHQAEMAAAAEAERKKLCTCAHVRVGDVWPHDSGGGWQRNHGLSEEQFKVLSVSPATCSARVEVRSMFGQNGRTEDRSCTQLIEPQSCPMCGRR
jgi:hypothetical protein